MSTNDDSDQSNYVAFQQNRRIDPQPIDDQSERTATQTDAESEQTSFSAVAKQVKFMTPQNAAKRAKRQTVIKIKTADYPVENYGLVSEDNIKKIDASLEGKSLNKPQQAEILRSEIRKSVNQPPTAMEMECLARQKPKTVEPTENKTSRQRFDQLAFQLRISSLWEEDGPVSKYKCLWPCYSAVDHDASLVRIDFIIDYLFNMFFIAHKGTTLERKQLLISYDTNVAEHMQHRDVEEESQELPNVDVSPSNGMPCESTAYHFDEAMFGAPNARNSIRSEVARPMASVEDIMHRKKYGKSTLLGKKRNRDEDNDNTTNSFDSDTDDKELETDSTNLVDTTAKMSSDPTKITLQQAAKFCKVNASVYEHLFMTKYEKEFPHSMSALHQRLFIGRLNRLEMLYKDEQVRTMPAYYAATRAFGLEDFNYPTGWSVKYIIALGKTMHEYIMALFSRIREKSKFEFPFVYGDSHARNLHGFYNGKLRQLNYQIEQCVRLLCTNCVMFQQDATPSLPEYPSILTQSIIGPHLCDEEVYGRTSPYQKILIDLHFMCQEMRLRKCNGIAYQEVITEEGYRTNSFREYCTIEELCNKSPNLITEGEKWLQYTDRPNIQQYCKTYMEKTDAEYYFPWLKRQSYVWSFRNGIYDGHQDMFWRYDSVEIRRDPRSPYNRKEASAKYIDKEFDLNLMSPEAIANPSIIQVDAVKVILDTQRFSPQVQDCFWAFTGRAYFPQRMLDNWQVVFWFKGVSGTGKSTLIHAISSVFESRDVGVMSNNIEPQFGLMNFLDKFLLIAPEVKVSFSLDSAMFQTMASADEMSIARKNLDPLSVPVWKVPSIYGSNVYPRWVDSSGSIQRRIMALVFPVAVPKQDNKLDEQFGKQIDAFIVRACRSYKQKIIAVGSDNIWDHVPDDFLVARREVGRQTTELVRFLDEYLIQSDADTPEAKFADFVEVSDLERLFSTRRQTGSERNIRFADQLEIEIGSFHGLALSHVGAAKTPIIRGVRLNLKRIHDVRGDPAWKPAKSSFYTEEEALVIIAKKEKFISNEINVKRA